MTEDISDDALLELIHRRYSDPTADWKDFDTQLAVLDIGRLLGVIIGQSKEIRHSKADQMALRAHVRWMAQTVHQAYHTDEPGAWNGDCRKDICSSTRRELNEKREP
jgi:hypothetical protein